MDVRARRRAMRPLGQLTPRKHFSPEVASKDTILRIYLSARWGRRDEMRTHRETLIGMGHEVRSRWLDVEDSTDPQNAAMVDVEDVLDCTAFIGFTETPDVGYTTGGRHVELGIAIARVHHVAIVGPAENVFCSHPRVMRVESLEDAVRRFNERIEAELAELGI